MTNSKLYKTCLSTGNPRESFKQLQASGMLWVRFPDAPWSWGALVKEMREDAKGDDSSFCACRPS